jgi:acyl-CoA thioester hydrolase
MPAVFSHTLEVRFRDCDAMGHVNNAVYLTYLEQARFAYWRSLWGADLEALPDGTPGVILARAEVDYRRPAKYGDTLEIRISLEKVGRSSITSSYEVVDAKGQLVANARTVLVTYDYKAGTPVPVSDEIRARLEGRP